MDSKNKITTEMGLDGDDFLRIKYTIVGKAMLSNFADVVIAVKFPSATPEPEGKAFVESLVQKVIDDYLTTFHRLVKDTAPVPNYISGGTVLGGLDLIGDDFLNGEGTSNNLIGVLTKTDHATKKEN